MTRHNQFSKKALDIFTSEAKMITLKKRENIHTPSRKMNKMFFIKSGLLRGYRIINGFDITHHFFVENWFATDYQSYLTGDESELFIEACIDTVVYQISKVKMGELFINNHAFENLGRILAEDAYLQMVERLKDFQNKDLKNRYQKLLESKPELINIVPQKHIASYLGVAPQSLSRIRAEITNE